MNFTFFRFNRYLTLIVLLAATLTGAAPEVLAKGAAFSFDSVWFYRDGTRVVPEISRRWLTVVFNSRKNAGDFAPAGEADDGFIRGKARAIIKAHGHLAGYLYDPNLSENACFFRVRNGLKPTDISQLIGQLSQDGAVRYVHPALVLDDKTYAYFNDFELEWKTGTPAAQRESLLRSTHVTQDEDDENELRHFVDVGAMPFFRALNLLAEDVRVLRVTPHLVEIKPSISARLSLFMSGGNIGDGIPFSLTLAFSDRVSIDPSSIATLDLRPQELQKELFDCVLDPYEYAKAAAKSPFVITGRMKFYAPGEYSVPPVKISYSCPSCTDSSVRSIETEPVLVRISSIIPTVKSENRLIVPTDPVAPVFRPAALRQQSRRSLWFAVACFAGLVPCAAWAFLLRRKGTAAPDRREERKREARLAEQLAALLQTTPNTPDWVYLGEVGANLREYLVVRHGIDPKYRGGSGRRFAETVAAQLPPECFDPLSGILVAIDNAVAQEAEHVQNMDHLRRDILNLMDSVARNGAARR